MLLNRLNQLVAGGRKVVDGRWNLTRHHRLQYRRRGGNEQTVLSGPLIGASARGLTFRVEEETLDQDVIGRRLTLRGHWQADSRNRLAFVADGRKGQHTWLTLSGGWEVDRQHALLYRLHARKLATRTTQVRTIRFQGHWDLGKDRRLTYVLDRASDSQFRFRGTFQTPSLLAKQGAIRYQVGVELEGRRRLQTITLFGKWKLSRKLELTLEVPYRGGRVRGMTFGTVFQVGPDGQVSVALTAPGGEPLGVEGVVSRAFLRGRGEAFVRLRASLRQKGLEAGVRFPW